MYIVHMYICVFFFCLREVVYLCIVRFFVFNFQISDSLIEFIYPHRFAAIIPVISLLSVLSKEQQFEGVNTCQVECTVSSSLFLFVFCVIYCYDLTQEQHNLQKLR